MGKRTLYMIKPTIKGWMHNLSGEMTCLTYAHMLDQELPNASKLSGGAVLLNDEDVLFIILKYSDKFDLVRLDDCHSSIKYHYSLPEN